MTHVSSRKLKDEFYNELFAKLLKVLGEAQNKKFLGPVINELFSDTEKTMFTKRLAILLMLDKHIPQHRISDILKVSPTTIAKISFKIEVGGFDNILKISRKEKVDLEKIVWEIFTVGGIMPPKIGGKYWRKYSGK